MPSPFASQGRGVHGRLLGVNFLAFLQGVRPHCARVTGYTEITRLLARHKMFFGSSKSVRCGLPTNRNLLGYAKRQRSRHETSYQYLGVSIGSWLFIAQKLTNADLQ